MGVSIRQAVDGTANQWLGSEGTTEFRKPIGDQFGRGPGKEGEQDSGFDTILTNR